LCFSQIPNSKFTRLTTSEGLSQNAVFGIVKDYKGFMWFATDEGLNKYDGYKFTIYKHNPENAASLVNNSLYAILEDATHNLWVLTEQGLDKFDRLSETFIHYNSAEKGVAFRSIFQDNKKRIWLGSAEGFYLFDVASKKFKVYKNKRGDTNSLGDNYVYKITADTDGNIWIANRGGLDCFNPATEKFIHYRNVAGNNKTIGLGYVKTVFKDSKGNIWAGTQGSGIALFNPADQSFTNFKHDPNNSNTVCHNDILSFTEDNTGNLWIGTENGGISILNRATNRFECLQHDESDPFTITNNSIHSLYKDDIGNIWAGTWSGGVNFLPLYGDKFTHYKKMPGNSNSLSNNLVLCITSDGDNNVWIGTDGGGLNRFNPATKTFTAYKHDDQKANGIYSDYILSVKEYFPGILALGFHRGGIDLFDIKKETFSHYAPEDLTETRRTPLSVSIVYKNKQNSLLLGNDGIKGLFTFNYATKSFSKFFTDSQTAKITAGGTIFAMFENKAGQFFIGSDKGLDLYNPDSKTTAHYEHDEKNKQSLSDNEVNCIAADSLGNLWLGTSEGLDYFDIKKNSFTTYTEKDGLPNDVIWGIQQDHQGNLWLSTNKGLSKFNPAKKIFRNYTIGDGLQSNTFKPKANCELPDGQLFFGGVNGFNTFYPDRIKDNDFVPPVYITGFQVFNKPVGIGNNSPLKISVNEVKEITLAYSQSVFTLEFAALNFTHPEQNQYAYQLKGFDMEWNYVGNKRTATYTNLNPGTYYFKVKASNNDGIWNETGTAVKIIITPPFWLTWWFILLLFLFIAGSIAGFYLFRMAIIQKQKDLLEQQVKAQTIQLVNLNEEERKARLDAEAARAESEIARQQAYLANDELHLKNKELEQFAYVASHDLQEPLRTTTGFITLFQKQYKGKIDEKADLYLHYISDASERMKVLIKDLLDFSRIGTKAALKKIDCNMMLQDMLMDISAAIKDSNTKIEFAALPVIDGYATEIKLLFQNLVLNAIKFRKKDIIPHIKIAVEKKNDHYQFSISDNGIGIEKKYFNRIFDIFQRLNTRDEYSGSGIGLAHCKKIVELHHGKIWVESIPGEGSTFYFTLIIHKTFG
jgi:signal transduction histidine kinase/ligand-binding sensor domain-containing protein